MSSVKRRAVTCTGVKRRYDGERDCIITRQPASTGIAIWAGYLLLGQCWLMFMRGWQPKTLNRWPHAYAGEISPAFGSSRPAFFIITQTDWWPSVLPLFLIFHVLPGDNNPIPAGIACIAIVWLFTLLRWRALGSRLTTIGLFPVLIPVVLTAVAGWHIRYRDPSRELNTSTTTDSHAIRKQKYFAPPAGVRCYAFESAAVSTGMVKNPETYRYRWQPCWVPRWQASSISPRLRYRRDAPASVMASSGAPFAISTSTILVASCAAAGFRLYRFRLPDVLGPSDDAGRPPVRAANDGNFPENLR